MSKIFAITSSGKTEKSYLDLRFGKCEFLVLFDVEKNQYSIEENPFIGESHSGIKLVDFLKKHGVTTIITGEVGPMVSERLEKEKLQLVLLHEERIRVDEIMDRISN
ncbi:NifB/NifX family molybdenum-iron cluster-binding protein [uncultured Draconibacterium sp.]|uniref:NifB/NifX family molybdenum-iron cluster-binding protein n=1 Tax=uncultured Draconibacterium sp. TaxID=1573823 RepID=UPI002AA778A8|nr:NifB/NifX family molybdenum-iron cluster-binding protein [uncultured Draconibacterium sp.]